MKIINMTTTTKSTCKELVKLTSQWPEYTGLRIMMMPIVSCDPRTFPDSIRSYQNIVMETLLLFPQHYGKVVYLTIDEAHLKKGQTHRRPGLHVDGVFRTDDFSSGGSWGGGGGGWGGGAYRVTNLHQEGNGMILFASARGCDAWTNDKSFRTYEFSYEGSIEHCRKEIETSFSCLHLKPNVAYWMNPYCIHESLPAPKTQQRQLVRISLPNNCPWFQGYTENPLGIKPTGPILPERSQMSWTR